MSNPKRTVPIYIHKQEDEDDDDDDDDDMMYTEAEKKKKMRLIDDPFADKEPQRMPIFPDVTVNSIPEELALEFIRSEGLGHRYFPLPIPEDCPTEVDEVIANPYYWRFLEQGSEAWHRVRKLKGVISASVLGNLLLLHTEAANQILKDISKFMIDGKKYNRAWDDFSTRYHTEETLPTEQLDLTSCVFMPCGTNCEIRAALHVLLTKGQNGNNFDEWNLVTQGLTALSTAEVKAKKYINHLDPEKRPFDKLDFTLAASPDLKLVHKTKKDAAGKLLVANAEIKCPTPFIPVPPKDNDLRENPHNCFEKIEYITRGESYIPAAKPYTHIPTYYLLQLLMQNTCIGADHTYLISWTPRGGVTVYKIKDDPVTRDMMITLLQHLLHKFCFKKKRVPTGYFFNPFTNAAVRGLYEKFLTRLFKLQQSAEIYFSDPPEVGTAIMKRVDKKMNNSTFNHQLSMIRMPSTIPYYMQVQIYIRAFFPPKISHKCPWNVDPSLYPNRQLACIEVFENSCTLPCFTLEITKSLVEDIHTMNYYHPSVRGLKLVILDSRSHMEKMMCSVLRMAYVAMFGKAYDQDKRNIETHEFASNLVQRFQQLVDAFETLCDTYACPRPDVCFGAPEEEWLYQVMKAATFIIINMKAKGKKDKCFFVSDLNLYVEAFKQINPQLTAGSADASDNPNYSRRLLNAYFSMQTCIAIESGDLPELKQLIGNWLSAN